LLEQLRHLQRGLEDARALTGLDAREGRRGQRRPARGQSDGRPRLGVGVEFKLLSHWSGERRFQRALKNRAERTAQASRGDQELLLLLLKFGSNGSPLSWGVISLGVCEDVDS
jgi:hypothetical protein